MVAAIPVDPGMLRNALQNLTQPVTMHYYTSAVESWYSYAERQLLEEIANASKAVLLQVHTGDWSGEREQGVGIARTPAIALYGNGDTGIRYYGMPDGYELATFLETLREVATGVTALHASSLTRLVQLTQPLHLEVVVSPT